MAKTENPNAPPREGRAGARYVSPSPSTIGVLNALFLLILDEALREICKAK